MHNKHLIRILIGRIKSNSREIGYYATRDISINTLMGMHNREIIFRFRRFNIARRDQCNLKYCNQVYHDSIRFGLRTIILQRFHVLRLLYPTIIELCDNCINNNTNDNCINNTNNINDKTMDVGSTTYICDWCVKGANVLYRINNIRQLRPPIN